MPAAAALASAGRGAAKAAEVGALASAARNKAPRVKLRGGYASAQRPVITTMTVAVGLAFLDAWLVKKEPFPERAFIVRIAILGFVLALMSEVTPRLGKGMSYLILTGIVFDRSQSILKELNRKPNNRGLNGMDGTDGTDIGPSPLTPQAQPVVLYQRQGPMTTEPMLPNRRRIKRPQRGAAFQV
jgi:hypothetical protein